MNGDPLLLGIDSAIPDQNSSTAPTVWEADTDLAAQQGIPCGAGPMRTLTDVGGIGVLGQSLTGSGIGVRGRRRCPWGRPG